MCGLVVVGSTRGVRGVLAWFYPAVGVDQQSAGGVCNEACAFRW